MVTSESNLEPEIEGGVEIVQGWSGAERKGPRGRAIQQQGANHQRHSAPPISLHPNINGKVPYLTILDRRTY